MKRYCLANYILTADIPEDIGFGTQSVSIGGEGSYIDTITVSMNESMFKTQGDSTGSWVHVKSLDQTGKIDVNIKQVSDKIATFKALINVYKNLDSETSGMTLTLRDTLNNTICIAEDCVIEKVPDQAFGEEQGSVRKKPPPESGKDTFRNQNFLSHNCAGRPHCHSPPPGKSWSCSGALRYGCRRYVPRLSCA